MIAVVRFVIFFVCVIGIKRAIEVIGKTLFFPAQKVVKSLLANEALVPNEFWKNFRVYSEMAKINFRSFLAF
jgi:hypothetical protein